MQPQAQRQENPGVPQVWFEWWCSLWSPYEYILTPARLSKTILCAANTSNAAVDTITVPEPMYVFKLASRAERVDTGAFPTFMYLVGFSTSVENWTGGTSGSTTVQAPLVTGDVGANYCEAVAWEWPREVNANDIINLAVDNPNNAQQIRVAFSVTGFYVRQRNQLLVPQASPTMMR